LYIYCVLTQYTIDIQLYEYLLQKKFKIIKQLYNTNAGTFIYID